MAEYTANSELSGSESKHDGQAMPEGHRWTEVRSDAEGAAACWAFLFSGVCVWVSLNYEYVHLCVAVCRVRSRF